MSDAPPPAIVGVVGNTIKSDTKLSEAQQEALLQLAENVGNLIATKGQIILTGGHHQYSERSVKYRALRGAVHAVPASEVPRVIGILPKTISRELKVSSVDVAAVTTPRLRQIYVHTQLKSKDRNPLTGNAVDVLIALEGGKGTAQEVDAALRVRRPVIFLNSWDALQPWLKYAPAEVCQVATETEAVGRALSAIGLDSGPPRLEGRFPEDFAAYPASSGDYQRLQAKYETELRELRQPTPEM